MKQNYFTYLPEEIIIEILARLPILTILTCKFVCKQWLNLILSFEFSKLQFPYSVPGIAIYQGDDYVKPYQILEFEEDLATRRSEKLCDLTFEFSFPHPAFVYSSMNGMLFMFDPDSMIPRSLFICNPLTREFVTVPPPTACLLRDHTFGFGATGVTGEYKIVKIFRLPYQSSPAVCEVYTLGTTRSWRRITPGPPLKFEGRPAAYLHGNLHWLTYDSHENPFISCLNLENEVFSIIPCPENRPFDNDYFCCFTALQDSLCICDNIENSIDIWVMKEYGVQKSWTKEYVINIPSIVRTELEKFGGYRFPVKIFEEGNDVLIADEDGPEIFCYSKRDNLIQEAAEEEEESDGRTSTVLYTPSFLPLTKMFATEEVAKF